MYPNCRYERNLQVVSIVSIEWLWFIECIDNMPNLVNFKIGCVRFIQKPSLEKYFCEYTFLESCNAL